MPDTSASAETSAPSTAVTLPNRSSRTRAR